MMPVMGFSQQWSTFRGNSARTGVSPVNLSPESLAESWTWNSEVPPDPAWDGPARWDAFSQIRDLPAMRQYDACFHPVSDGEKVYFGSSAQDTLFALSMKNGSEAWKFVAGGPIRLAPTLVDNQLLFGCDDGNVYCLNKTNGELNWKFSPAEFVGAESRKVINNDRLISYFPIRTGITVRDSIAYFGASFLPWRESYICAIDLESGRVNDESKTFVTRHEEATLEGNLLIAENRLIVPQGRVAPRLFDRQTGKDLGSLPGGGGVAIVLTEAGDVVRAEGGRPARAGQVGVFKGKERVASFPRGKAIVVSGNDFFVIDGQKLFAADRQTNELRWVRVVDEPLELIMVGGTLFVGGRDHVTAVRAKDGMPVWSAKTDGRTFGLAFAEGHLIASTDQGAIHVYSLGSNQVPAKANATTEKSNAWISQNVTRVRDKNLIHRWVFHRSAMTNLGGAPVESASLNSILVKDQASGIPLKMVGVGKAIRIGEANKREAIEIGGGMFPMSEEVTDRLPRETITIATWVRVDEAQQWGGIAGFIQDDGVVEHGVLLGYRSNRFCWAVAGGGNGLTYMDSNQSFEPGTWHHVVGTYNGQEMRLYVDGALAVSGTSEKGKISISDKCFGTIGAYRDTNESFPLKGALHEIRIYSNALTATEVARDFQASAPEFKIDKVAPNIPDEFLAWGPFARFVRPGVVNISYGTVDRVSTVIDVVGEKSVRTEIDLPTKFEHQLAIGELPHKRELQFQIRDRNSEDAKTSKSFSIDTHFDWTASKFQNPVQLADEFSELTQLSTNPRGLVFVVGAARAKLATRLAAKTQFNVVLLEEDQAEADQLRQKWASTPGLTYSQRLNVVSGSLRSVPAACATVVIGDETPQERRLVRPQGGILSDGKSVLWKRKSVEGSGTWSHMYGNADNSAFGGESLSNASDRKDLTTQWIGRPGPRYQTDRQNRKPSPLAAGGRLFLQGQQRMIALDSYSGVVLWSVESPTVMRWNVPHDCSNWCADSNGVFVAAESQAWFVNGRDGEIKKRFDVPVDHGQAKLKSWGFIARHENQLIGTVVDANAIYKKWWGKTQWFDSTGGDDTHVVAGERLFSMDPGSGELHWKYDGLVLHPTITIMDGKIVFVEDKTVSHLDGSARRVSVDRGQSYELVCLDVTNGNEVWRQSLPGFSGHVSSLYLAGGGEPEHRALVMVASEASLKKFSVYAFEPASGKPKWNQSVVWESNHHGKHISRPAIQGDLVYLRPEVLQLADGKSIHRGFPGGHGCSSYTLCTNGLFSRLGETTWWDVRNDKVNRFKRIRTDCWISVVPAQGMLLSAEGGGGCSCGTWMETSLGFLPQSLDEELPEK